MVEENYFIFLLLLNNTELFSNVFISQLKESINNIEMQHFNITNAGKIIFFSRTICIFCSLNLFSKWAGKLFERQKCCLFFLRSKKGTGQTNEMNTTRKKNQVKQFITQGKRRRGRRRGGNKVKRFNKLIN